MGDAAEETMPVQETKDLGRRWRSASTINKNMTSDVPDPWRDHHAGKELPHSGTSIPCCVIRRLVFIAHDCFNSRFIIPRQISSERLNQLFKTKRAERIGCHNARDPRCALNRSAPRPQHFGHLRDAFLCIINSGDILLEQGNIFLLRYTDCCVCRMEQGEQGEQDELLEVVPYDTNREVVLRHNNAVVVYDPSSQQLALRSYRGTTDVDHPFCPTCQRPWQLHETPLTGGTADNEPQGTPSSFRDPEYFRMVQRSLEIGQPAAPPSPRRRLVHPTRTPPGHDEPIEPLDQSTASNSSSRDGRDQGISSSAFSQNFLQKVFVFKKELGRGGRGVVFLVEHVLDRVPLGLHACKRIPVGDNHEWLEKVLIEVQLLSRLHHQNLVAYQHVWLEKTKLTNFGPPVACAYILQEYCNGGDLQSYVVGDTQATITKEQLKNRIRRRSKGDLEPPRPTNEARTLEFDEIYSFFRDITAGIQFLHANGFIHRDLKPNNCLLHKTGREVRVLVSDFGEVQEQDTVRKSTGATGTVSYCAPEVLTPIAPGGPFGNFTFKSDIFSLGMILHFICFASLPYRNANILNEESEDLDTLRAEVSSWKGFNGEQKHRPDLPDELYMFLRRLLAVRPEDRPTADDISNGLRTRTGLADAKSQRPPRTPPPGLEELTPRRRIVSLDSPAPGSPRSSPATADTGQPSTITRRASHLRNIRTQDSPIPLQPSSRAENGSQSAHRDLILRPPLSSPKLESGSQSPVSGHRRRRSTTSPETIIHHTYLLTDGSAQRTVTGKVMALVRAPQGRRILNLLLVLSKIISILQPCASRGINPVVTYPLLLLALWDFGIGGSSYGYSMGAVGIHCAVLGFGLRSGTMCAPRRRWTPDGTIEPGI